MAKVQTVLLDSAGVNRALTRIAHEILEHNRGSKNLALIGIRSGGDVLGRELAARISKIEQVNIPCGSIDIGLYRDDLSSRGTVSVGPTDIPFSLDEMSIILVDDVLFTGRTIRAAMDALMDFGRPRNIQLAVLVDRGHRELPIRADFVGRNVPTALEEKVDVLFDDDNRAAEVHLLKPQAK
jgi:pyrimidine operon attenuation protein/uracil phosphoribosyltransferase